MSANKIFLGWVNCGCMNGMRHPDDVFHADGSCSRCLLLILTDTVLQPHGISGATAYNFYSTIIKYVNSTAAYSASKHYGDTI